MTETGPSKEQAEAEDVDEASPLGAASTPEDAKPQELVETFTEEGAPDAAPTPSPAYAAEAAEEPEVAEEPELGLAELGLHIGELAADAEWSEHIETLGRWRQGHLVENIPVSWMAPAGVDPMTGQDHELGRVAPFFLEDGVPAVICSQTCDLGGEPPGSHHPFVHVAPLVHGSLLDDGLRKRAQEWQVGYLAPVNSPFPVDPPAEEPAAEDDQRRRKRPMHEWFADLRLITPVSKALLLDREPIEGFGSEELYEVFAETLGYKLRRPALHQALSQTVPDALDKWVKKQGKTKTYIANVEHVRVLIFEGTALEPTRADFFVISNGIQLNDTDVEAWQRFQTIAADLLRPRGIAVGPLRCTDVSRMTADLYRRSTPIPSDVLNAPGFP